MNQYLIDTHILVFWYTSPDKIKPDHRTILLNPKNQILISLASIWELYIKATIGKLKLPPDLQVTLSEEQIDTMPIKFDHIVKTKDLPLVHGDPFDRLIIATAIVEDIALISYDKYFDKYPVKLA